MIGADIPRYRPTYREDEVWLIRGAARKGESICLVGVAGIGKTNLIHFLYYSDAAQPPSSESPRLLFAHVDARQWAGTAESLWDLMLDALTRCEETPAAAERAPGALTPEARARQTLSTCARQICRDPQTRLMFLLDDFDEVLQKGPLEALEALNSLRGECRDQLSYLVFTKRLPHVLGQQLNLETGSKFYRLFSERIYALTPLNTADARQMLERLNAREAERLPRAELGRILQLTGGHCGLLWAVYRCRGELGPPGDSPVPALLRQAPVREACKALFRSLHLEEQQAAIRLAQGSTTAEDRDILGFLCVRGLAHETQPVVWFSPIWALYLRQVAREDVQP